MVTPTHRMFGRTKIDALDLDSSAWYIDDEQVTASADDLNSGNGTYDIYNNTGGALTLGMPLYVSGIDGTSGYPKVVKADADDNKPAMLFATDTTAYKSTTTAVNRYVGAVTGFNTSGGTEGDPIYLSETAGAFTLSAPTNNDAFVQVVGYVTSKATSGECVLDTKLSDKQKIGSLDVTTKFLSGFGDITPAVANDLIVCVDNDGAANATMTMVEYATALAGTTANSGLAASSGVLGLGLTSLTGATIASGDKIPFSDEGSAGVNRSQTIDGIATFMAGTGLTATSGVLSLGPDFYPVWHVYSAVALAVGDLLHITSYNEANGCFVVEKADGDNKPAQLIAQDINAGTAVSHAVQHLHVDGVTTVGAEGTILYLDAATAGNWTETAPTGADQLAQRVGHVRVTGVGTGKIVLDLQNKDLDTIIGSSYLQGKCVTAAKLGSDVAGTGLSGGNGAAITLADKAVTPGKIGVGSIHVVGGHVDTNVDTAVDVDLGVIGVKGTILQAIWTCETAADKDTTFSVSKQAAAASKVTGDNAVTAVDAAPYKNTAGATSGVAGTGSIDTTNHLYLYANASGGRSAGLHHCLVFIQITA